jgi:sugar phosphate isomerase/epimerase
MRFQVRLAHSHGKDHLGEAQIFMKRATALLSAVLFVGMPLQSASARPRAIGAELYTVRVALADDFESTLRRVAAMGYGQVEFAGYFGRDPKAIRALLSTLHLTAVSAQIDWKQLRDHPADAIAQTKALGARYMVHAWMPPEERQTLGQWRIWIAHLNKVGKMARAQGLRFAYHAHDFEYQAIDGVRPIDLLEAGLDPKSVDFEMDIYWTVKGGGDPAALLKRFPGRFPLAHIKDMSKADTKMVDVGDGRIDFAAIFKAAGPLDFNSVFVERDDGDDPFRTLERSLAALKSIKTR